MYERGARDVILVPASVAATLLHLTPIFMVLHLFKRCKTFYRLTDLLNSLNVDICPYIVTITLS